MNEYKQIACMTVGMWEDAISGNDAVLFSVLHDLAKQASRTSLPAYGGFRGISYKAQRDNRKGQSHWVTIYHLE